MFSIRSLNEKEKKLLNTILMLSGLLKNTILYRGGKILVYLRVILTIV